MGYLDVLDGLLGDSRRADNRGGSRRGDVGLGYYTGDVLLLIGRTECVCS